MEETDRTILINSFEVIKSKLLNVLNLKQFCGLCMEYNSNYVPIETMYNFSFSDEEKNISLNEIISYLFHGENVISSSLICDKCIEKIIQSYTFINEIRKISRVVTAYINDLSSKVSDISHHVDTTMEINNSNVVIVIESNEAENIYKAIGDSNFDMSQDFENDLDYSNPTKDATLNYLESGKDIKYNDVFLCEHCYKMFPTQQDLTSHSKTHFRVRCKICQLIIPKADLTEHMDKNHKNKTHSCTICKPKTYNFNFVSKKDEIVQCPLCLNSCKPNLKNHNCEYKCTICLKVPCLHYKHLISYREQVTRQKGKVKCIDCNYLCDDRHSLVDHVNRNHLNFKPYQCDYCGQHFYDKTDLQAHMQHLHQENYICKNCDLDLKNRISFKNHQNSCIFTDREFKCFECSCSFNCLEELTKHISEIHKNGDPCDVCKSFPDNKELGSNEIKAGIKFICPLCNTKFDEKNELDEHITKHDTNIKYPCIICDIKFKSIKLLEVHNNLHHATVICSNCTEEISKKKYRSHLKVCSKKTFSVA